VALFIFRIQIKRLTCTKSKTYTVNLGLDLATAFESNEVVRTVYVPDLYVLLIPW